MNGEVRYADKAAAHANKGCDGCVMVLAEGKPKEVAGLEMNHTKRYLKPMLAAKKHITAE